MLMARVLGILQYSVWGDYQRDEITDSFTTLDDHSKQHYDIVNTYKLLGYAVTKNIDYYGEWEKVLEDILGLD